MTATQQAEQIWLAYPKKLGNKKKAIESIKRSIEEVGFQALLAKVNSWVAETAVRIAAPGFWATPPYGATFFNQERWRDEFPPIAKPAVEPAPNMDGAESRVEQQRRMLREARGDLGDEATGMTDAQAWERIPELQRDRMFGGQRKAKQ